MPHDSSNCPVCHTGHRQGMSDPEFHVFLTRCRDELQAKQEKLIQRQHGVPYQFDLETEVFTLGSRHKSCVAIGSYCPSRSTWLWAWANDSFPDRVRTSSARFKHLHEITGFRVFVDEGIKASRQDVEDFTAMAVHLAGGSGFWRSAGDDFDLYLCLIEPQVGHDCFEPK